MTEGTVGRWLKQEGDAVQRGDVLAEIETDKATMELEAYESGVLTRIIAGPGTTVEIGLPIAVIGDDTGRSAGEPQASVAAPAPQDGREQAPGSRVRTSPLARTIAREHGLDIAQITGTGPGGRIVRADVEAAVAAQPSTAPAPVEPPPAVEPPRRVEPPPAVEPSAGPPSRVGGATQGDQNVVLTPIRRITAQRLTESAAAPQFYLTGVVDAQALLRFRSQVQEQLTGDAPKISITDLLIRACAVALRAHPEVNSSWGGDHLVRHGRVNVGFAVALDDGLIVPIVQDADRKSLVQIATEAHALALRARAGGLKPEEFSGSTFTISNLGMFGVDHFTAVINPPEAAILAVGAAREAPVVRDGRLAVGVTMKLTLSVDHRVLNGAEGAAFLARLVDLLQQPLRIVA
jgi:pyruvate dehydrogenase E2 component (dihydrolipoamide acetyltransferase)